MYHGEIEGSGFETIESEFARCFVGHARLERLWTGCRWAEGPDRPRHIRRLQLSADGRSVGRSEVFAQCPAGFFDGFRIDDDDRVWAGTAQGVHVYRSDGTAIGRVRVPEMVANVAFGGPRRNRLFICGTTSLYAIYLKVNR